MSVHLTADDTRRIGAVAQALLTPPPDGSPGAWVHAIEPHMHALLPGANVLLSLPEGGQFRHYSGTVDGSMRGLMTHLMEVDPHTGRFRSGDVALDRWRRHRRAHRISVWNERRNARDLEALGTSNGECVWYNEGLVPGGLCDYTGITSDHPSGELFLCVGYRRHGQSRRGPETELAILELLLPALRAGHHALVAAAEQRAALGATLDAVSDALLVVGAEGGGRVLHRNRALGALLAAEPERERVVAAMVAAAADVRALPPAAERAFATATARYALRAWLAPEALWGAPGVALVSLAATAAPAPTPAPDGGALARAYGLTAREAEVARLLARRLSAAELADALGISVHTARRHTESVMRKLGVHSRQELAAAVLGA
jgi:DNA-binding CsgD family transcriptional regulator